MPELPDVAVIERRLAPPLATRIIGHVEARHDYDLAAPIATVRHFLLGNRFRACHRYGDLLFLELDRPPHLLVRFGLLKGLQQPLTHCLAEGVNRRVVDRDQRDIALNFEPYDICHDWPPLSEMLIGIVISRNHVSHSRIKESRYACR